jgi:hypothetical protein
MLGQPYASGADKRHVIEPIAEITANYAGNPLHSGLLATARAFSLASAAGAVAAPEG